MKIAILLSGGVDSSYALHRLVCEGHDVYAFYLKIWLEDDISFLGECPWDEDIEYANKVCKKYSVPLKILSMQREYYDKVVSYVITELKAGFTPSPDIFCNLRIKFGAFFDKLSSMGEEFDLIASGHYSIIQNSKDGFYKLFRAKDPVKDQSYFLSFLSQKQLSKMIFPIGDITKQDLREMAEKIDLPNKKRKDSQGICFLGKVRYSDFIKHYLGVKKGEIIEKKSGKILGEHLGFWFYTIGQRTGLGLGNGPYYVFEKDIINNVIFVVHADDLQNNAKNLLFIENPNWISGVKPDLEKINFEKPLVKLRHGPKLIGAKFEYENEKIKIQLDEIDSGIAYGQFAVIYNDQECIGAGKIVG